jgi:hypothetical protein
MKTLRLTAISIALLGYGTSVADESPENALDAPAGAQETSSQLLWSDFDPGESTLLMQANAVYAALRAREAAEQGIEVDTVTITTADAGQTTASAGNCRHLAEPGSLFMRERCFYETSAESAANEFQYRMEMQQNQELHDINFLESAEYEMAYRRFLAQQQ